jgi:hypothetical protein
MTTRKWRLVEGKIFKLSRVFESCIDALNHTRILSRDYHAILVKTDEGKWATYWRARDEIQCEPKPVRIASASAKGSSKLNR